MSTIMSQYIFRKNKKDKKNLKLEIQKLVKVNQKKGTFIYIFCTQTSDKQFLVQKLITKFIKQGILKIIIRIEMYI